MSKELKSNGVVRRGFSSLNEYPNLDFKECCEADDFKFKKHQKVDDEPHLEQQRNKLMHFEAFNDIESVYTSICEKILDAPEKEISHLLDKAIKKAKKIARIEFSS